MVLKHRRTGLAGLQTIRHKAFIPQQKIPAADEMAAANENHCLLFPTSKKRDAVGTGQIKAAGKIAGIAVVAEYRGRGASGNAGAGFQKKCVFVSHEKVFLEAGIPYVLASLD